MSDRIGSTNSGESLDNKQMGGKRRKNGHKYSCKCPICINMKHAKRGGDNDNLAKDIEEQESSIGSQIAGRKKKSNGHKKNCGCPICKNMRKKGGDEDKETPDVDMNSSEDVDMKSNETEALDSDYDDFDQDMSYISGGTRRRKSCKRRRNRKTRKNKKRSSRRRH